MFDWVKKLLGSSNDAEVKKLQKTVNAVEALEDEYKALTDEQLRAKTDEFRTRLQNGETEDDILPEAFAAIRAGNAAMYYPEANVLVGRGVDPLSKTPAFKGLVVTLRKELQVL